MVGLQARAEEVKLQRKVENSGAPEVLTTFWGWEANDGMCTSHRMHHFKVNCWVT